MTDRLALIPTSPLADTLGSGTTTVSRPHGSAPRLSPWRATGAAHLCQTRFKSAQEVSHSSQNRPARGSKEIHNRCERG